MPVTADLCGETLDLAQAAQLAVLVDLEARWENLRTTSSRLADVQPSTQDLYSKQKAYDAFRAKLAGYNKQYAPAHVPEVLLNTPARLGLWCRAMRDLYSRVEQDHQGHCPAHLLEKAYRWADRMADRLGKGRVSRSNPPGTIRAAILDLEALQQWCVELTSVAPAMS
jgi:hypothetical protein